VQWLTAIILAIWEVEIRRITVQGQPGQIVLETPIYKKDWGSGLRAPILKVCSPAFKLKSYHKKILRTKILNPNISKLNLTMNLNIYP
jgi:hypothetical protein